MDNIDFRMNLRDHRTKPVPFGVPVIVIEPTISNRNAIMVIGTEPRVYTAWTPKDGSYVPTDYANLRPGTIIRYNTISGGTMEYSRDEFLKLDMLWCPRPVASKAIANMLAYFGTQPNLPDEDDEEEDHQDDDEEWETGDT